MTVTKTDTDLNVVSCRVVVVNKMAKRHQRSFGLMEKVHILMCELRMGLHLPFAKTHGPVHLTAVQVTVCKLHCM